MTGEHYRVYARINRENALHNLALIRKTIPDGTEIMAIVKEDAYGHGAVELSKLYAKNGVSHFGVASLEEALELRAAGIKGEILVLGRLLPDDISRIIDGNVSVMVSSLGEARELSDALIDDRKARRHSKFLSVHIKADTGFSRYGFYLHDESDVPEAARKIWSVSRMTGIKIRGIMTHFADADDMRSPFTERQFGLFTALLQALDEKGVSYGLRHCANSAATLTRPTTHLDMVRCGIALYGLRPSDDPIFAGFDLRPVMGLYTTVTQVTLIRPGDRVSYGGYFRADSPRRICTIGIGYGDGYSRVLSHADSVVIRGRRFPVVGKICMNACMVDATGSDVGVGDEVEIFGDRKPIAEISARLGTIDYEVLCMVSERVKRI